MPNRTLYNDDGFAAQCLIILSNSTKTESNHTPGVHPNARNNFIPQPNGSMSTALDNYTGHMEIDNNISQSQSPMMHQVPSSNEDRQSYSSPQSTNSSQEFSELRELIFPPPPDRRHLRLPSLREVIPTDIYSMSIPSRHPSYAINISQRVVPSQRQIRQAETQPYPQKHHHFSVEALRQYHSRKLKSQVKGKMKGKERMSTSPSQESITQPDDAELDAFFLSLKQHYRNEFEKELKEQTNSSDSSDTQDAETDSDDGSLYRPSSSEYASNNSKAMIKYKKTAVTKKNSNTEKPRWTLEEKAELFEAVVRHKSLDIMATFDWAAIGADIGRLDKACKDQWRRGILKMFRDSIHKLDNP